MTALCRFDAYEVIRTLTDGDGPYSVKACELPATVRVSVSAVGDGLGADVYVSVCADHGARLELAAGFIDANPLATVSP